MDEPGVIRPNASPVEEIVSHREKDVPDKPVIKLLK